MIITYTGQAEGQTGGWPLSQERRVGGATVPEPDEFWTAHAQLIERPGWAAWEEIGVWGSITRQAARSPEEGFLTTSRGVWEG